MGDYLKSFLMAGSVVAGIEYLANEVDPALSWCVVWYTN